MRSPARQATAAFSEKPSRVAVSRLVTCVAVLTPPGACRRNVLRPAIGPTGLGTRTGHNASLATTAKGTQDAIERSYAEDFTVLPPVFLHEAAVIENSVIGPFVNLEAHAVVRNSIVRNSLIGTKTEITKAILSDSLIGNNVQITGHSSTIIADDGDKFLISGEEI